MIVYEQQLSIHKQKDKFVLGSFGLCVFSLGFQPLSRAELSAVLCSTGTGTNATLRHSNG